ncbi:diguanylate cyclase (GGDEF) domain-containing protein [Methylophilus rhizosphaerae]|uniref:diguanylate cyclase n=1 Tax=Methylophilus rhizosphaerae TaxID=492660 RepID=A0A1G8Z9M7_9PROT|nr:GGDEF domain-containing protein [Methylophilus rhizosphaerae]SDK11717.1 diguanylate cyclase (GGDEF) domain-containing protein [Methylophilus rhizosphaerae]
MTFPVLDLNSVILSSIGLALTLVLVLLVFGAYQQKAPVMRWAGGLLTLGGGYSLYFISRVVDMDGVRPGYAALAMTLAALGISIYVNGIRMLRGYRVYRYRSLLVMTILLSCNTVMLNLHAPVRWLILGNLFILVWVFVYGCRSLAGYGTDFVAQVFWLCCSLFASLSLWLVFLMLEVVLADEADLASFLAWPVHAYMAAATVLVLMAVTSLLLLVMNIRTQAGLQAMATMDSLTGTLNRRGLQDSANRMQAVSQRMALPMGMLIVDLDYFKKVNDVYGHLVGDVVLTSCAATIRSALRGGDVIGRYGGEEFCILLPNTGEQEAMVLAERIRRTIEKTPVSIAGVESMHDDTRAIKCTVSVGAVSSETVGYALDGMFAAADQNLYKAKQHGRNRVASNMELLMTQLPREISRPAKRHARVIA